MLFNSIDFAVFLPIVFILYWFVVNKSLKLQNFLIVAASYIFYGWWDWRFLSLILFSTLVDYFVGLGLLKQENQGKRKILYHLNKKGREIRTEKLIETIKNNTKAQRAIDTLQRDYGFRN